MSPNALGNVVAHGIDAVEVDRIADLLARQGDRFRERCFTELERSYAAANANEAEHVAARFAAKEAAMKCLGTGWAQGVAWTDFGVERQPSGKPTLVVSGRAAEISRELGISGWLVSLTHTRRTAHASVIALG